MKKQFDSQQRFRYNLMRFGAVLAAMIVFQVAPINPSCSDCTQHHRDPGVLLECPGLLFLITLFLFFLFSYERFLKK